MVILLVGDNLREQEEKSLSLYRSGHRVITAGNVREGFRQTRREQPDIILCEFDLPDLSGVELCRMIREDVYLRSTPFVFAGDPFFCNEKVSEAMHAGADDYLPASVDPEYLPAKVQWLVDKSHAAQQMSDYYDKVRSRHIRIANIVKETSTLMRELNSEYHTEFIPVGKNTRFDVGIDERIDIGIEMIRVIADLVEEQTKAMDVVVRNRAEDPVISLQVSKPSSEQVMFYS